MNACEMSAIRLALADARSPCIVELGACTGEDSPNFESLIRPGETLHHVMVEPDPRNVQHILDNCGPTAFAGKAPRPLGPRRRLILGAVARESGFRQFHFSEHPTDGHVSGSLLEPTGHLEHVPATSFPHVGMVQCWTLDQIFQREYLKKIDLLWVDIQGAESEMIAGGKNALAHTRYCFMEAETVELYRGEALKPDLIALLPGWKLTDDFGYNILLRNERFA
jgi:FkbM family methyltransferase